VKALVTGATGFVGSHLAAHLAGRGDDVRCLARQPAAAAWLAAAGAQIVPGSLDDAASLRAAVVGVDVVFHLAGATAAASEAEFLAANAAGTARLLEAAAAARPPLARFVYISSLAAVGPALPGRPVTEGSPCRPVTAYGRSKLAGEEIVRRAALPWTIVRPTAVYGPRDRELLRMFRLARFGVAPVFGRGRQELSLVYVEDLAVGLARAGVAPAAAGATYHLAHPAVVLARDLVREIGLAVRGRAPVILPVPPAMAARVVRAIARAAAAAGRRTVVSEDKMAEFLAPSWATSVAKAQQDLEWRPAHDLRSGVAVTAEWYRAEGLLA